ncbi:MAG: hypothetical protein JST08_20375 [Actinobacteria bacterium]|nr:hypothetical protein [Actinomycetota bacterium]
MAGDRQIEETGTARVTGGWAIGPILNAGERLPAGADHRGQGPPRDRPAALAMVIAGTRLLAPLVVAAVLAAPSIAAGAPNELRHDLGVVNGHLRIAIEFAPEELGESLRAADLVCGLGERAVSRQEADLAAADWTTLGQLVDQVAAGESRRVEVAFANADSVLRDLRKKYEGPLAGAPTRLRELRRGVRETRRGIATMRKAVDGLATPFGSWKAHECGAATQGVEKAFAPVPAGLERINVGMLRLWRLAELPPPPTEGR